MTGRDQTAREKLRGWAGDLEVMGQQLRALHDLLPVSPRADVMLLGEEETDFATEARRFIECALGDHIEPLIRELLATAAYGEED